MKQVHEKAEHFKAFNWSIKQVHVISPSPLPIFQNLIRLEFPPEAVEVRGGGRRVLTVEEGESLPGVLCTGGGQKGC